MIQPYDNIPPGEFIKETLDDKGLSQMDFAEILGISAKTVSEIINAKQGITPKMAKLIASVLGYDAEYWLRLENNYRLRLSETKKNKDREKKVKIKSLIYDNMPINDMRKLGWIKALRNQSDRLIEEVKDLLGVKEITQEVFEKKIELCFRKSGSFTQNETYTAVWFEKAKKCSLSFSVNEFDEYKLDKLLTDTHKYTIKQDGVKLFLEKLNEAGVKFFVLYHLPKTYIDGASFKDDENPVVVYTMRFDRLDNFWFTVLHEIGHIKNKHTDKNVLLIDNIAEDKSHFDGMEKSADDLALSFLKRDEIINYFKKYKYISKNMILTFSTEIEVHPSIIVGILQHKGILPQTHFNKLKEKISDYLPKSYIISS